MLPTDVIGLVICLVVLVLVVLALYNTRAAGPEKAATETALADYFRQRR